MVVRVAEVRVGAAPDFTVAFFFCIHFFTFRMF